MIIHTLLLIKKQYPSIQILNIYMMKIVLLTLLVALCFSRNYPMFKQCDSRWGSHQLGTSSNTICKAGCLMSSASMALAGTGHNYNPDTLNSWLKANGGYVSGDLFVWTAINKLGLTYKGKISNSQIKGALDAGEVVILNVRGGAHFVLAHGYSGDNILVNDPGFDTSSYALTAIMNGNTGVYSVNKVPAFINNLMIDAKQTVEQYFGQEQVVIAQEQPAIL